jgi:hypothetical protein
LRWGARGAAPRIAPADAADHPTVGAGQMDQSAAAELCEWQPIGLIHPADDSALASPDLGSKCRDLCEFSENVLDRQEAPKRSQRPSI